MLRYFTVYGPAGRPDMSVFHFIRRIAEGEPVVVYGDGMQRRDFTYIDDVAVGTLAALRPAGYEIINLGASHPVSLLELIEEISHQLGRPAQIERRCGQSHGSRRDLGRHRQGPTTVGMVVPGCPG